MSAKIEPYEIACIRSDDSDGVAAAAALAEQIASGERASGGATSLEHAPSEQVKRYPSAIWLVGRRADERCGLVWGSPRDGHTFDLHGGGVLADHRGRGLGITLLRALDKKLGTSGYSQIRCGVGGDRRSAMRLLLAFGMKVVGVLDEHPGRSIQVVFGKAVGDPGLTKPKSKSAWRGLAVTVEAWPIKRLCELERIYQASFGELLDDGHPTLDEMVMLDSTYENYLHVALADGEPVGFKQAQERTRGLLHSHIGAVHPDARGAGIASKLMVAQHAFAKQHGFGGIATRSRNRYPQMVRLNLKHGFHIVGVVQALGEPAIHMFKRLK